MIHWLWLLIPSFLLAVAIVELFWHVKKLVDWRKGYMTQISIRVEQKGKIEELEKEIEKFEELEAYYEKRVWELDRDIAKRKMLKQAEHTRILWGQNENKLEDFTSEQLDDELNDRKLKENYPLSHDIKHSDCMTIRLFIGGKFHGEYTKDYAVDYTKKYVSQYGYTKEGNKYSVSKRGE